MPEYRENELCYEDYRALRTLAGWETHSEEQTRRALAAALYDVTAVEDGPRRCHGAFGGDGLYDVIAGVVVAPEYQGRGIGKAVAEKLLAYAQSRLPPGGRTSVQLLRPKARRAFTRKAGLSENAGRGLRLCAAACAARTPGGIRKRPCPAACSRPERGRFAFAV